MIAEIDTNFNPHFRKGSDVGDELNGYWLNISIHTSAREVTNPTNLYTCQGWHFNPHFRKGSDLRFHNLHIPHKISIHTSAREVTILNVCTRKI